MAKAKLIKTTNEGFSIQIDFKFNKSMLTSEENILEVLNDAGIIATGEVLSQFDTDGLVIKMGNQTFTTKGQFEKTIKLLMEKLEC